MPKDVSRWSEEEQKQLTVKFDEFLEKVYRRGMGDLIRNRTMAGRSGFFLEMVLRSLTGFEKVSDAAPPKRVQRTMFSFVRRRHAIADIHHVSFVVRGDDPTNLSVELFSGNASCDKALRLIDEVILDWPETPELQERKFHSDPNIAIGE